MTGFSKTICQGMFLLTIPEAVVALQSSSHAKKSSDSKAPDASIFSQMQANDTNVPIGSSTSANDNGAKQNLVLHFDLNKTVLAIDSVKHFGAKEVIPLEMFKGYTPFLKWACPHNVNLVDDMTQDDCNDQAKFQEWKSTFDGKTTAQQQHLIDEAKKYIEHLDELDLTTEDAKFLEYYKKTMQQIHEDNTFASFWKVLEWAKEQRDRKVLVVFRTNGEDMPDMFEAVKKQGYGQYIVNDRKRKEEPLVYSVMHEIEKDDIAWQHGYNGEYDVCEVNNKHYLHPYNAAPAKAGKLVVGEVDHHAARTKPLESRAKNDYFAGSSFTPVVYTGQVPTEQVTQDGKQFIKFNPSSDEIKPFQFVYETFEQLFEDNFNLKIMGVRDNYKSWSRFNPANGKAIMQHTGMTQIFFDDYIFSKSTREGPYIVALFNQQMKAIQLSQQELDAIDGKTKDFGHLPDSDNGKYYSELYQASKNLTKQGVESVEPVRGLVLSRAYIASHDERKSVASNDELYFLNQIKKVIESQN